MKYDEKITVAGLVLFVVAVLANSIVSPQPEPELQAEVQPISKAEYKAAVGPLLDQLEAACGEAFDASKFYIEQLPNDVITCVPRAQKVASP